LGPANTKRSFSHVNSPIKKEQSFKKHKQEIQKTSRIYDDNKENIGFGPSDPFHAVESNSGARQKPNNPSILEDIASSYSKITFSASNSSPILRANDEEEFAPNFLSEGQIQLEASEVSSIILSSPLSDMNNEKLLSSPGWSFGSEQALKDLPVHVTDYEKHWVSSPKYLEEEDEEVFGDVSDPDDDDREVESFRKSFERDSVKFEEFHHGSDSDDVDDAYPSPARSFSSKKASWSVIGIVLKPIIPSIKMLQQLNYIKDRREVNLFKNVNLDEFCYDGKQYLEAFTG
jgi:hypothetical protein